MGLAALVSCLSRGSVDLLVVLYSINVFLTSLSLLGLCIYWWRSRHRLALAPSLCLSARPAVPAESLVTTIEKFGEGG
jgi:hypothetical protein